VKKVVSYSIWGSHPEYTEGAIASLKGALKHYPGWEYWFYVNSDVPSASIQRIQKTGGKIIHIDFPTPYSGLFHRFLPIFEADVSVMLSRDADSIITEREAAAVKEWLDSEKAVHIIRDHPTHVLPMMGGLWGAKTQTVKAYFNQLEKYSRIAKYGLDQRFLALHVYPHVRHQSMIHTESVRLWGESVDSFPMKRNNLEFIGKANRSNFTSDQDMILKSWINNGAKLRTVPNIFTIPGRIWLLLQLLETKLSTPLKRVF
jgi:hypothetical protein